MKNDVIMDARTTETDVESTVSIRYNKGPVDKSLTWSFLCYNRG